MIKEKTYNKKSSNNKISIEQSLERIRNKINEMDMPSDDEVYRIIEDEIFSDERYFFLSSHEKRNVVDRIFYRLRRKYGILEPLLVDSSISEIMINGIDSIFIERQGMLTRSELCFESIEELEEIIRKMAAGVRREINELTPIVDARLESGARVNAIYKNIALDGPVLTIRKFPKKVLTMEDLISYGTITKEASEYLRTLIESGYNIFISGGTSSGKTTFLNVLSSFIPKDERVIVIEDSAELQISEIENIVRMECRNANFEGKGKIDMQDLIKASLRMRPDRIIVGEVRGREVVDMIQAMNTGHDGSLCTGHGNSVQGMLKRLEAMFLQSAAFPPQAIRNQISEGIDIMVHMGRLTDKRRQVLEIAEISRGESDESILVNTLFKYNVNNGLERTENKLQNIDKLLLKGRALP